MALRCPRDERRVTAHLAVSAREAYAAYSVDRAPWGPNGESKQARLVHTVDAGHTWRDIPWRRALTTWLGLSAFAAWPPEHLMLIRLDGRGLEVTFADEWCPFEPGGESLWRATYRRGSWRIRWVRFMDYEGRDASAAAGPSAVELPPSIRSPFAVNRPPYR
jgi:hypothetical protein